MISSQRLTDDAKKLPPLKPRRPDAPQAELRAATQAVFLSEYANLGTVRHAALAAGIHERTHYDWLDSGDPAYADAWAAAQESFTEHLEREAARRAVDGQTVGVYYQGERVAEEQKKSDNLLMFLLKARRPEVYKDRTELTGANGGPVQVQAVRADALARLSGEELAVLLRLNPGITPKALHEAEEPIDVAPEPAAEPQPAPVEAKPKGEPFDF